MPLSILKYLNYIIIISTLYFLAGCSNSYIDNISRGEGYEYRPGYPELRIAATGNVTEENDTEIIISGDVVYGSLIYSKKDDSLKANVDIQVLIFENTSGRRIVERTEFERTLAGKNDDIIHSQDSYRFENTFQVSPGDYLIQITVTDKTSDKRTTRSTETSIPNPEEERSHITEIRILGKDTSKKNFEFNQVTTYDIPSNMDSLKFVFQVTNNDLEEPISIQSRLVKFRADTSIARPMNYNNYSSSSLSYRGIDYSSYEELQTSTRELNQPGSVLIEFAYSGLKRGNYRLEVTTNKGEEDELYRARDFSIKSENYPSLNTPKELAMPLNYLMSRGEFEKLMSIKNPDSLKEAIDRFWLSNIKNSNKAKSVISLYYQRVEEANKQFSNFKEGWKTDPGMVYILFGPPWYSDQFSDQMVWSYSYNMEDPEKNFTFYRTKLNSKYYPFNNYLLARDNFYYTIYYQQTEKWRTGLILNDNL